jgi:hypothetical protein
MRTLALIFAFYFLLLAILPAAFAVNDRSSMKAKCGKTSCCKKNNPEKNTEEKNDCSKNNCTPLFGCSKVQLIANKTDKAVFLNLTTETKYPSYSENFSSTFTDNTWHPPRVS